MEGKPPVKSGKKVRVDSFLLKSIDDNAGIQLQLEKHSFTQEKSQKIIKQESSRSRIGNHRHRNLLQAENSHRSATKKISVFDRSKENRSLSKNKKSFREIQ
jgi:hypothetical protein